MKKKTEYFQSVGNSGKLAERYGSQICIGKTNGSSAKQMRHIRGACRAQDGASPTEDSPAAAVSRGSAGAGPVALPLCWCCCCPMPPVCPCEAPLGICRLCADCASHALPLIQCILCSALCFASRAHALPLVLCLLLCKLCPVSHTVPLTRCLSPSVPYVLHLVLCLLCPCSAFCSANFALSLILCVSCFSFHPLHAFSSFGSASHALPSAQQRPESILPLMLCVSSSTCISSSVSYVPNPCHSWS